MFVQFVNMRQLELFPLYCASAQSFLRGYRNFSGGVALVCSACGYGSMTISEKLNVIEIILLCKKMLHVCPLKIYCVIVDAAHTRGRSRNFKRGGGGGPAEFSLKRGGGPITYSGAICIANEQNLLKKGRGDPDPLDSPCMHTDF